MGKKAGVKRLFWDIETSPCVGYFWRPGYKITVPAGNVIKDPAIICICYKWEGHKKVHHLEWDRGDDYNAIKKFLEIANQADELVAHNGDKFDWKWFKSRLLIHRLPAPDETKTVDTLKIARKHFSLKSNRLDELGKLLFGYGKIKTEFKLWSDIMEHNCPKAMKDMVDYCKQDVRLLEEVFSEFSRFHKPDTHAGVVMGRERWTCSSCGSENVRKNMTKITAKGIKQHQMQCKDCGKMHSISTTVYEQYCEAKEEERRAKAEKKAKENRKQK